MPPPTGLTNSDVQQIITAGRWALANAYKPAEIGRAISSHLLKAIVHYLQQAADSKNSLKFLLLSAHDTTQLGLLSAMSAPLNEAPPYAADLNFLLFKNAKQQYFVKITFNGKAVVIPGCNDQNICTLKQLAALT